MKYIAIDTATAQLSLACAEVSDAGSQVVASYQLKGNRQHGETLVQAMADVLARLGWRADQVDRLVVGIGPGSYTGLRMGVTAVKVWASQRGIPVETISSLALMLPTRPTAEEVLYVPVMDARRSTVYSATYQLIDGQYQPVLADRHIAWTDYVPQLAERLTERNLTTIHLYGDPVIETHAAALREALPQVTVVTHATWLDQPTTERVFVPAFVQLRQMVEDVDTLAPNYCHATLAEQEWLAKQKDIDHDQTYIDITQG